MLFLKNMRKTSTKTLKQVRYSFKMNYVILPNTNYTVLPNAKGRQSNMCGSKLAEQEISLQQGFQVKVCRKLRSSVQVSRSLTGKPCIYFATFLSKL